MTRANRPSAWDTTGDKLRAARADLTNLAAPLITTTLTASATFTNAYPNHLQATIDRCRQLYPDVTFSKATLYIGNRKISVPIGTDGTVQGVDQLSIGDNLTSFAVKAARR